LHDRPNSRNIPNFWRSFDTSQCGSSGYGEQVVGGNTEHPDFAGKGLLEGCDTASAEVKEMIGADGIGTNVNRLVV
jgi:hypothetical protein